MSNVHTEGNRNYGSESKRGRPRVRGLEHWSKGSQQSRGTVSEGTVGRKQARDHHGLRTHREA